MARKKSRGAAGTAASPMAATGDGGHARLMAASWALLLAALVTPMLTDSPRWLGLARPLFRSGPYLEQAYVAQVLVMGALTCLAAALWTRSTPLRWHPALGLALALLAWTGLATVLSPSPATAVLGLAINSQGLLLRIVATAVLVLTVQLAGDAARIRVAARAIGLVGAASAAVALLQAAGANPIGTPVVWAVGRSFGTLGNPDMFGGFVMFGVFVSLGVALSEKTRAWRVAMWTATAVCAASAITSYSRAAWIGLVVGSAAFAIVAWRARVRIDRRLAIAAVTLVLAVGAFAALRPSTPGSSTDVADRLTSAVSLADPDSAARLEVWATAFRAIARRPVQGYGPDTMMLATEPVRGPRLSRLVAPRVVMESAHSIPIQTMTELGVPGFLLWAAMLAAVAMVSLRTITGAAGGTAAERLVLTGLWAASAGHLADSLFTPSSVAGFLTLSCVLGLLVSWSATARTIAGAGARRSLAAALAAAAVAGTVVAVCFMAADVLAGVAGDGGLAGARRIEAGARAVRLDPLSVDYALVYSTALIDETEALGKTGTDPAGMRAYFARALAEARRAVAIEPTNQRRRSFLAGILLSGARYVDPSLYAQALAESSRAVRMSPNDLQTRYEYARILDPARARPVLASILRERPSYAPAAMSLAEIDVRAGDSAAARRVLAAALGATSDTVDRAELQRMLSTIP